MASYDTAQEVVICEVCEQEPVVMYCKKCHVRMCNSCIGKHVSSSLLSQQHDLVGFKFRKSSLISPKCRLHNEQKCEMFCNTCDVPVCSKCIVSEAHKSHKIVDVFDQYEPKKRVLIQQADELESRVLLQTERDEISIKDHVSKIENDYDDLICTMRNHLDSIHHAMRCFVEKDIGELEVKRSSEISQLTEQLDEIKSQKAVIHNIIIENRKAVAANDVDFIFNTKSTIRSGDIPTLKQCVPTFIPTSVDENQLRRLFGSLKLLSGTPKSNSIESNVTSVTIKQLRADPKLLLVLQSGFEELRRVCCTGRNDVWMMGNVRGEIKRMNELGELLETVSTLHGNAPQDIQVTMAEELVYCDMGNKTVNKVNNGESHVLLSLQKWRPTAICCASDNSLIVGVVTENKQQSRVCRYVASKAKLKIQFDEKGIRLFTKPLSIAENLNRDICLVDGGLRSVLVFGRNGSLRFRYGDESSLQYPFMPGSVATDSESRILVTDKLNNCIHITDQNGQCAAFIGGSILFNPVGLSIDQNDRVWVAEFHSGKVKVLQYVERICYNPLLTSHAISSAPNPVESIP